MNLRTFCITLPEYPEKTEIAVSHFRDVDIDVQFFNGVHGEKFGLKAVHPYKIDYPDKNYTISFKEVGIWMSHWALWNVLNFLHEPHFLILEIDALFPKDWHSRVVDALNSVPDDFDMLYIGSCCAEDKPKTLVKNQVWDVRWPACNHAYVVAKKALPVLLSTQRKCCSPMDISLIESTHPKLKIYTVLPSIVMQRDTILKP